MTIEEKLVSSHENLVEGISILILKELFENKVIGPEEDVGPHMARVNALVEAWLKAEYDE